MIEADPDEHGAREKRHAPTPGQKLGVGEPPGQAEEHAGRAQETERRAELRKAAVPGLLAGWRVLGGKQDCPTPFAAESDALSQPAYRQQHGGTDADGVIRRQDADEHGRGTHRQECGDERRLAPDAIPEMTEQRRADGPREEGEREGGEGLENARRRIILRKEQLREHQRGGGGIDVEIEKFDRRADQTREQNAPWRFATQLGSAPPFSRGPAGAAPRATDPRGSGRGWESRRTRRR